MRHQQSIREALVSRDTPISVRIVAAFASFAVSSMLTGSVLSLAARHSESKMVAKQTGVSESRPVRTDGSMGDASEAGPSSRV